MPDLASFRPQQRLAWWFSPRAADFQHGAVGATKMLPANTIGVLNVSNEHDAGRKHDAARFVKIVHSNAMTGPVVKNVWNSSPGP
jgi:hypothetical protein